MDTFLEPKFSGGVGGKAPRRMVKKSQLKPKDRSADAACAVEETALSIYIVCGFLGCCFLVIQVSCCADAPSPSLTVLRLFRWP